jgi:hypothetical protein
MPMLVEMTLFVGDSWESNTEFVWLDSDDEHWVDTNIVVNACQQGYAGKKYWDQTIISVTPPQFRTDHASGGYCKLSFGDITLTRDVFSIASIWPPPQSTPVVISYADENDVITELFNGTAHRQKISRDGYTYQFYERTFDQLLLDEDTEFGYDTAQESGVLTIGKRYKIEYWNDNDDFTNVGGVNVDGAEFIAVGTIPNHWEHSSSLHTTVPIPRAFGLITHQQPVRLIDAESGNIRYSAGYLIGSKHTDWHVYDDGVDICSNATEIIDNVFELTASPVGEVTISGTGEDTSLIDIFEWTCAASRLNLSYNSIYATAYSLSHWANSQEVLVSFLDRIAASACHIFHIKNDTMTLIDMDSDVGNDFNLTEADFFPSSITFAAPVALIKTTWTDRIPVEETIGKHIKEISHEVSISGLHPYGSEETIDCFQTSRSDVVSSLTRILSYVKATRWETSIPIKDPLPLPGSKISAYDESMGQGIQITIHARDIEYDFENHTIMIAGEGTVV